MRFILFDGGVYTTLFWLGQVLIGGLLPIALVFIPATSGSSEAIIAACVFVVLGGFAQLYGIIIGGQAYPMVLFPGMEVSSSLGEGSVAAYQASLPELLLGLGGIALALAIAVVGMKVLRFLPASLDPAAARASW